MTEKFPKRIWNVASLNVPHTSHRACTNYFIVKRIYSKILDLNWFSAHLFVTQSPHDRVGLQSELFVIGHL